jgi:signal peptide peptidase-like protein 2B
LGDIVLPGLLLSFAARYDAAKRFIGSSSRDGSTSPLNCAGQKRGYFPATVVAYAIGLAMANYAVYAMKMGQPALLYLVPCCLGTMTYLGWRRGELSELWNTPKVLASCDEILYGPVGDDGEAEHQNLRSIT